MRLNVGCGAHYADGWVNIDSNNEVYAEFHADAADLPFADGDAEMVYLGHLLEMMETSQARQVLTEARRVLAPAGFLVVLYPTISQDEMDKNAYLWDMLNTGYDPYWRDKYLAEQQRFVGRYTYTLVSDVFPESVTYLVADLMPEWPTGLNPPWLSAVLASKPRSEGPSNDRDGRRRQRSAPATPAHRRRRQRQPAAGPDS